MNCLKSRELLQRRLDGSPVDDDRVLLDLHLAECRDCRELHGASQVLLENLRHWSLPQVPEGLSKRIVREVRLQRRKLRRTRLVATAASLAASLLIGLLITYVLSRPSKNQDLAIHEEVMPNLAPASLQRSVEEAGQAVVALTRRTADETVGQTRLLLPAMFPESPLAETPMARISLQASTQSLVEVKDGMSAGLEPVASSARRAIDLFLREIPPLEKKPKS
jgi:hypothetical protein